MTINPHDYLQIHDAALAAGVPLSTARRIAEREGFLRTWWGLGFVHVSKVRKLKALWRPHGTPLGPRKVVNV